MTLRSLIERLEILGSGSTDEDDKATMLEAALAIEELEAQLRDRKCCGVVSEEEPRLRLSP